MKDYYYILGIEKNATTDEIKVAFRKLSKKFHPDVNPEDKHAEKIFKDINEAHETLIDNERRRVYDQTYRSWINDKQNNFTDQNKYNNPSESKDKKNALFSIAIFGVIGFVASLIVFTDDEDKKIWFLIGIICAVALIAFMAPFIVSVYNRHPFKWAVLAANFIIGWTGLGWIACLIFALYQKSN